MGGPTPRLSPHGAALGAIGVAVIAAVLAFSPTPANAQDGELGKEVYDQWCAGCHGVDGDGTGPGAGTMIPRPRDFTRGVYQLRTTASGELPMDADIMRIINVGMPGTAMPGWEDQLTEEERLALVEHLKTFSRFFAAGPAPEPLTFTSAPRASEEVLAEGRRFYEEIECFKCHGDAGRGDGTSSPTLGDDWDFPVAAADLTENWLFTGGSSVEDIYRRLRTGLDGTPMPNFSDLIDAEFMTDEQLWSLAHYVRSLSPEEAPEIGEVFAAALVEGAVPTTVDDAAWDDIDPFYVRMVGQIVEKPRWFNPRVDGIWVKALHDGNELAMLLTWSDPSMSPDTMWAEWQSQVIEMMEPKEGDDPEVGPIPDRIAVEFPTEIPDGMQRPFFLMGDGRDPVYLWQWQSDQERADEAIARGRGSIDVQPASDQSLAATASWDGGQWKLLFRRALTTDDEQDLQFTTDAAIPVGFFAWDGDNGEAGRRGSISTWYFVYLEEAVPATVIVAPLLAILLTGILGVLVVAQAQKREREAEGVA